LTHFLVWKFIWYPLREVMRAGIAAGT